MSDQCSPREQTSLSLDASPQPPRKNRDSITAPQEEETRILEQSINIPKPHADWQFHQFLGDLADSLTPGDLEKMKFTFSGDGGIGRSVLEKIKTPRDLFTILKTRQLLSRDNQLYLQKALFDIGRMDLVEKGVDYAKATGDCLIFYPESLEPENGYKYVKWHVEGKDFRNCRQGFLHELRWKISNVLFIPAQYIVIAGVQPSSSLLITFMIPDRYVELLLKLLEKGEDFPTLQQLGIDVVSVAGKTFNLKGVLDAEIVATEQQTKLTTVYEQLQEKEKQLESTELELVNVRQMMDDETARRKGAESKLNEVEIVTNTLQAIIAKKPTGEATTVPVNQALDEFKTTLTEVAKKEYDKRMISKLLERNTKVVAMGTAQSFLDELTKLKSSIATMEYKLARYQYLANVPEPEWDKLEQTLLEMFQILLLSLFVNQGDGPEIVQTLTQQGLNILRKISRCLRPRDRTKLERKYHWAPGDKLKQQMDKDQSLFLAGIFYKEVETHGGKPVDYETFFASILSEIGREDLKKKFLKELSGKHKQAKPQPQQSFEQNEHSQEQEASNTGQPVPPQTDEKLQLLQKISREVEAIYQRMETMTQSYQTEVDNWQIPGFDLPSKLQGRERSSDREVKPN